MIDDNNDHIEEFIAVAGGYDDKMITIVVDDEGNIELVEERSHNDTDSDDEASNDEVANADQSNKGHTIHYIPSRSDILNTT